MIGALLPGPPYSQFAFDFAIFSDQIVKPDCKFDSGCSLFGLIHRCSGKPRLIRRLRVPLHFAQAGVARDRRDFLHRASSFSQTAGGGLSRASFEEIAPRSSLDRVDVQLMAMIDAARKELARRNWPPVGEQVLMAGLSAAGSFTNRFTLLHPARVLAAAVGSPGGWPIAPVAADQGKTLRYPVGIADVENLIGLQVDLAALRRVRMLFFLGDHDTNDAVGYVDSYSPRDSELIRCLFGETLLKRWRSAKRLYDRAGVRRAQFKVYPGGHEVTSEMRKDILDTFRKAIDAR